jgi:hypothetical protein
MRKLFLALLVALALPAPAAAKELSKLDVCGPSRCKSLTGGALLRRFGRGSDGPAPTVAMPVAPYYKLRYHVRAGRGESFDGRKEMTFVTYFIPAAGLVRGTDERGYAVWNQATPEVTAAIAKLPKGLKPYPSPRLTRVSVGGTHVSKPATYARLITITSENTDYVVAATDWLPLRYHTATPSPWDGVLMEFSAKEHALYRNRRWIDLDSSLARQVRIGAALTDTGGSGFPWGWIGLGAAVGLVAAGAAVAVVRRPWQPRTA